MAQRFEPDFSGRFLKAVYCRGEPDRVPLVEAGIDAGVKARFLGRPIRTLADEVAFWATAGYDVVPLEAGLRTIIDAAIHHAGAGRYESSRPDHPQVAEAKAFAVERLSSQNLTTQAADGSRRTWAAEGQGFITSLADVQAFPWPDPRDLDYSTFELIGGLLPFGLGAIPFSGAIFSSVMLMMGFQACLINMGRESDLFQALVARVGKFQLAVVRHVLDFDAVGGIWINDDLGHNTDTLANPRLYRRYIFPYYREIKRLTEARGVPLLLHSDGRITRILPDLVEIGFNALHPIDPNCMDIAATRRVVGPSVCLIGNLSLADPLGTGTPAQVAAATEALIRQMAPGGGYCLSSGNSIPDYVPYENWKAMRDTALRVGVYPVQQAAPQLIRPVTTDRPRPA
jgi:uroporphyrinogen decarboxylase